MRKMLILARDAGHEMEEADVHIENILPQAALMRKRLKIFTRPLKPKTPFSPT
jgi:aspartokinase/homoserine dehydrogenase 1